VALLGLCAGGTGCGGHSAIGIPRDVPEAGASPGGGGARLPPVVPGVGQGLEAGTGVAPIDAAGPIPDAAVSPPGIAGDGAAGSPALDGDGGDGPRDAGAPDAADAGSIPDAGGAVDVPQDSGGGPNGEPDGPPMVAEFRPVVPLSAAVLTSRQPTLRWTDVDLADYYLIDLCRDPRCESTLSTLASGLTTITLTDALPAGVLFWRVRAALPDRTFVITAVWELVLGSRGAPQDGVAAWIPDLDGDGRGDVAQAAAGGEVLLSRLGPGGVPIAPAQRLPGPARALAYAPDVDGDGVGDLIVGRAGSAEIYRGSASGLTLRTTLTGAGSFGGAVAGAGDVDGDGYGDVLVGAPAEVSAWLFRGSAAGVSAAPAATLRGGRVGAAGDVDADGYADVVACAPGGPALLYRGSPAGLAAPVPLLDPRPAGAGTFGHACAGVGDLDGDGYADLAVTAVAGELQAIVFYGGPRGPRATTTIISAGPAAGHQGDDLAVGPAGDVDGDGQSDLLVAGPAGLRLHRGAVGGVGGVPAITVAGPLGAAAALGDVDGDGDGDLAVAPATCAAPVQVLGGGAMTLPSLHDFPRAQFPSCPLPLLAR
jgi:hypothetical protein